MHVRMYLSIFVDACIRPVNGHSSMNSLIQHVFASYCILLLLLKCKVISVHVRMYLLKHMPELDVSLWRPHLRALTDLSCVGDVMSLVGSLGNFLVSLCQVC